MRGKGGKGGFFGKGGEKGLVILRDIEVIVESGE